jgi:hypothetical protein
MKIDLCKIEDILELQEFIHNHWKEDHILSRNRDLFNWQYVKDNKVNFLIMKHRNKIRGMLGFTYPEFFMDSKDSIPVYWLNMWRSTIDGGGMFLLDYFMNRFKPQIVAGSHLSDDAMKIYEYIGYSIDYLNIYYMVNQDKTEFEVLGNFKGKYISEDRIDDDSKEFSFYNNAADILEDKSLRMGMGFEIVNKSLWKYIKNRYANHPVYNYYYISLNDNNLLSGIIVYRIVSKCIFIVDFFGYFIGFSGIGHVFQILMQENDVEYIVFMNYGWDRDLLASSGFMKRGSLVGVVVPTLFEPFERKNNEHSFCYKFSSVYDAKFIINKGISDFDRPNE